MSRWLGMFAAYASPRGRALIDRELYLPRSWFADPGRLAAAGVADDVVFATKPQLGLAMVERTVAAAAPLGWVAADEAFGGNPDFRGGLEELRLPYVVAVSCTHRVRVAGTDTAPATWPPRSPTPTGSASAAATAPRDPGTTTGRCARQGGRVLAVTGLDGRLDCGDMTPGGVEDIGEQPPPVPVETPMSPEMNAAPAGEQSGTPPEDFDG